MPSWLFITLVSGAILLLLLVRTIYVVRKESAEGTTRGSEPGQGHHVIHAEYSSGLSGHSKSYEIPRDPQAYARMFVPKETDASNDR